MTAGRVWDASSNSTNIIAIGDMVGQPEHRFGRCLFFTAQKVSWCLPVTSYHFACRFDCVFCHDCAHNHFL